MGFCHSLIAIIIAAIATCSQSLAQDSTAWPNFVEDYRKGLNKLESMHRALEVEGELVESSDRKERDGKKSTKVITYQFFSYITLNSLEKNHFINDAGGFFERVFVISDREKFVLRRDTRESGLFLEQPNMSESFKRSMFSVRRQTEDALFHINQKNMKDIISSRSIVGSVRAEPGGDGLYRVDFSLSPDEVIKSKLSGWFVVSRPRHWALCDFDVVEERGGQNPRSIQHSGHLSYAETGMQPHPVTIEIVDNDHGMVRKSTLKVSKWNYQFENRKGFELSDYGLGDAVKTPAESSGNPLVWWLVLFGLGAGALSFLVRFLSRRFWSNNTANE